MNVNIEELCRILRDASIAEVMPSFRRLGEGDVRQKKEAIDLVTRADEAAERFITARINQKWPEALVLGEEAVSANPELLDGMAEADLAIFLDPIDGTANYAAGLPLFGVMAAVVARGEVVAGIIFDPLGDDWILAEKGSGAFLMRPDGSKERLKCLPPRPLAEMVGSASVFNMAEADRAPVLARLAQVRMSALLRTAAHGYRTFASGHFDYVMYHDLMPWDHAPGTLIATEAGGYAACFEGRAYDPARLGGGLLVASDKDSWQRLMDNIFRV